MSGEITNFENRKEDMIEIYSDEYFMRQAILQAELARDKDEVPIGAVVVRENQIIARGHNLTETLNDVTAHAEMQAFTSAASYLGGKFLNNCTLYVTLEPCTMCAGAAYWTRVSKIVYGASELKRGYNTVGTNLLHPKTTVVKGVMEVECGLLLKEFFEAKRREG